jgi:NADH pyrophosphatase NudC (nudix superfamily)
MTNQEAITIIGNLEDKDILYNPCDVQDAKTMAIKALEQEPKTGHWITKEAYSEDKAMGITEQIVCSNCDMQNSYFSEWDECKNPISKTFIRSKYCPNCGAKMQEWKNDKRGTRGSYKLFQE